ncbi:MAG: 4Fe-4S dicluster domain-containing protein [Deferribacteraceae bacterium]|jgi:Fe-S-cluster-containing dehydrogenase component|nr:4Fe-4S dicluster domain-containing protein [Deferribacteraceae bacterium]
MPRKTMIVDINRCIGCLSCVVACKAENNVEIGKYWTWVERETSGVFPTTEMYFLPRGCFHCGDAKNPPECIKVCPTSATYKRGDGTVLINHELCIGCGQCVEACPYSARILNSGANPKAEKCTLCTQLTDNGEEANCVQNCPGRARMIGDLDNAGDPVTIAVKAAGDNLKRFRQIGSSNPNGGYILRNLTWKPRANNL